MSSRSSTLFLLIVLVWKHEVGTVKLGIDVTPPQIKYCPDPITEEAPLGQYKTTVSWTVPTATDDSEIEIVESHSPGSYFYIGTTYVAYSFIDASYNFAQCQFTVTVTSSAFPSVDITPPILTCPSEKREFVSPGSSTVRVEFRIDTRDNSGEYVSTYEYPPSGSSFPVGVTKVWVSAVDRNGNAAFCSFDVIVSVSDNICLPNPCPQGKECYGNSMNTAYKCEDGTMTTKLPTVGCRHPGQIENGFLFPDKNEPYPYGSKVIFACQHGYVLDGVTEIICSNEMTWSSELPRCVNGDISGQGASCQSAYSVDDLLGAIFGAIIGILVFEVILFAAYRRYRLNHDKPLKSNAKRPLPASHMYTNNPSSTEAPPRPTTLPQNHRLSNNLATNPTYNNNPVDSSGYQGLDPLSRDREHKYMSMATGSVTSGNDNRQTSESQLEGGEYATLSAEYIEVVP